MIQDMYIKDEPFEDHTERYERWFERNKEAYLTELKALETLLPENGRGIEIGVGSGRFSEPFSIKYGIDPSRKMLRLAANRDIEVIQGIGEKLPLRSDIFDFALIVTTICFFESPKQALEEAYRILKSEGDLIIGFIDKDSPVGKEYQRKKEQNVFYREAKFYSVDEVTEMLIGAGFSDLEYSQTLFNEEGVEEPELGCGKGSFVVVKACK